MLREIIKAYKEKTKVYNNSNLARLNVELKKKMGAAVERDDSDEMFDIVRDCVLQMTEWWINTISEGELEEIISILLDTKIPESLTEHILRDIEGLKMRLSASTTIIKEQSEYMMNANRCDDGRTDYTPLAKVCDAWKEFWYEALSRMTDGETKWVELLIDNVSDEEAKLMEETFNKLKK